MNLCAQVRSNVTVSLSILSRGVSPIVLLFYDYILTLPDEIDCIWRHRRSLVTLLFFLNRYLALFHALMIILVYSDSALSTRLGCSGVWHFIAWLTFTGIAIAEVIFTLRTAAIWEDRKLIVGLVCFGSLLIALIPAAYVLEDQIKSIQWLSMPIPGAVGCASLQAKDTLWIVYTLLLVYQTVIFGLTLRKVMRPKITEGSSLAFVLYRDGFLFYILLLIVSLVNIIGIHSGPSAAFSWIHRVLHAVLSSRLILNIRKAALVLKSVDTTCNSTIVFARHEGENRVYRG